MSDNYNLLTMRIYLVYRYLQNFKETISNLKFCTLAIVHSNFAFLCEWFLKIIFHTKISIYYNKFIWGCFLCTFSMLLYSVRKIVVLYQNKKNNKVSKIDVIFIPDIPESLMDNLWLMWCTNLLSKFQSHTTWDVVCQIWPRLNPEIA